MSKITNIKTSINRQQLLDILQPTKDGWWELTETFHVTLTMSSVEYVNFDNPVTVRIQMTKGMVTDLITDPLSLLPKMGVGKKDYIFAPVVHDKLFKWPIVFSTMQTIKLNQKESDQIFKALLLHEGLDEKRAHFMYKILRNWGWIAWLRWRVWSLFQ